MLETYQQEIIRKRKASRIFWMLVFLFAGFLYFFFQGYYPAIDFSFRELTTSGASLPKEPRDLIRSFGIINVSVKPDTAKITLGSGSYSNDEKRMTNYGTYRLSTEHDDYLASTIEFTIDKETPYYIDILTLLPNPRYSRIGTGAFDIMKIDATHWISQTASGMFLTDDTFSGGYLIGNEIYPHLGEGYFLSGKTLVTYNITKESWESKTWSGATNFMKECRGTLTMQGKSLWCPQNKKALTENGKVFTGVINVSPSYFETSTSLILRKNPLETLIFGTGARSESHIFIEKSSHWYTTNGGVFVPVGNFSQKKIPPIVTPLENIEHATWVEGSLVIIGRQGSDRFLTIYDPDDEKFSDFVNFPETPLIDVRIEKYDGNLFFKTKNALLFLYHNSREIEWLIDGEIIAFGKEVALYRKESGVWKANWQKGE